MNLILPPEVASDLDPLVVTSPTIRSGTTLLQRLLCSSSNTLVYGEECGKDLELMLQIYRSKAVSYLYSRERLSAILQSVLDGEVNQWTADLLPDVDGYVGAFGRASLAGLAYCRDYAAALGRPVWGIKYPGWPPNMISLIRRAMPRSRFLIIYRDVADCLRSAKARGSVASEQAARQFCGDWKNNLSFMLAMRGDPSVFLLKYAELVTTPASVIEALVGFTGARDIRPETLSHRINVEGASPTDQPSYVEPAALTETEKRIADEAAAAFEAQSQEEK
jgi:Sulfotransferase family